MNANDINDEWWQWRRGQDAHDREQDTTLASHATDIAVLQVQQRITSANAEARHSKTPAIAFGLVSAAVSLIVLVMQILAWRGSAP